MKGGMGNLMKQAQMMQANLQKAQDELGKTEVTGEASNGQVKIVMTCKNEVKNVEINESIINDKEMLEDLVLIALKDVQKKIEETASKKMSGLVPPGMNLPF
jgi:DNA-binding YbaB/EbfC family protein